MTFLETDAIVLRTVRYGEADVVLSLYSPTGGRLSAIAKGARKTGSKLGGRLQPGVWATISLARGRGALLTVRSASVVQAHAGVWISGYRLRAASSLLETVLRTVPEDDASPETFHLLSRALGVLSTTAPQDGPPRLDPVVLGFQVKLLLVSGFLPRMDSCAVCGSSGLLVAFSAHAGGVLCRTCQGAGEPLDVAVHQAMVQLLGHPLVDASNACPREARLGVERIVGLVLQEHLGVTLRSATPV